MGLHQIDFIHGTAVTGAIIGEKEYQGKGYGTDAKMTLLNYAFNTLNLRKVCSDVISFNKRSLAYSKKCGYKIEGRQKQQFYRSGKYYDRVFLAIFRKNWPKIWAEWSKK